jgi:hypothetical protein
MGKNSKPILSVLVDEDKKDKFADIARRNKYSMGWLLNDCIDRMIEADSIDIYGEPARSPQSPSTNTSSIDIGDVEKMVKTSIDNLGIESMIETYVSSVNISSIGIGDVEKIVNTSVGTALDRLTEELSRLETEVTELKGAIRDRSVTTESLTEPLPRRIAIPTNTPAKTTDKDPSIKSWAEFFKMVGMDALTATEAQKKENIDTRTEQIEQGLQAAKEQGLGEWIVKVAGRSFEKLTEV